MESDLVYGSPIIQNTPSLRTSWRCPKRNNLVSCWCALGRSNTPRINPCKSPTHLPRFSWGDGMGKNRKITWAPRPPFGGERGEMTAKEETPSPVFEMLVDAAGKFPSRTASICPRARIQAGRATVRLEEAPQQSGEPQLLTGLHHIEKGSEISDPRILRHLPAEASDIHLISDRNGHMAHYRISPKAFDAFLKQVWKRYRENVPPRNPGSITVRKKSPKRSRSISGTL